MIFFKTSLKNIQCYFFLTSQEFLVESAFYITKKGGGESFGKLKDETGHDGEKDSMEKHNRRMHFRQRGGDSVKSPKQEEHRFHFEGRSILEQKCISLKK